MAYEQKPLTGVLFKNDKKNDKQPDYRGKILDSNGKEWALAAWVKEGKSGKFFSLKLSEPQAKEVGSRGAVTTVDNGGDLPF